MRQVTIDTMTEMWTIKDYRTIFNNEQTYAIQGPGITNVKKKSKEKNNIQPWSNPSYAGPWYKKMKREKQFSDV